LMRSHEPAELRCMQLASVLRASGCKAWHEHKACGRRSINASVELGTARIDVSVGVDTWCDHGIGGEARLAFQAIDARYLLAIFERGIASQSTRIGGHALSLWRADSIEESRPAAWCVVVRTDGGLPLSIRAWPDALPRWLAASMRAPAWYDRLSVELALSIGRSHLKRRHHARLECGDVILVQSEDWLVKVEHNAIGSFALEEEFLKLNLFDESRPHFVEAHPDPDHHSTDDDVGNPDSSTPAKLDDLPIQVEFLLSRMTLTLADLRQILPGATYPVQGPDVAYSGSERRFTVTIRAGRQTIGEGELVAVNDALAVQVTRVDLIE
jgi:type III secretion system YscQ/HrcQ family protein